jgi:PAS domain-containing protein
MWSIRILTGTQKGQIYDLKLGKNIFGRGAEADFKVNSVGISKEHCEIHVYKDKMIIIDLKSSNGTFVNGVKVQNSRIGLSDKVSLFDVIMDVIPKPEIRPALPPSKKKVVKKHRSPTPLDGQEQQQYDHVNGALALQNQPMMQSQQPMMMQQNFENYQIPEYGQQPEFEVPTQQNLQSPEIQRPLAEKFDLFVETKIMPAVYKLASFIPFKQVFLGFTLFYIFMVTVLSLIPLITLNNEANIKEASLRAKSVARAISKLNESNLMKGQFNSLNVNEALKEDGIKDAFIIQHSDGSIIAPPERAGRDANRPFIAQARRELKATAGMIDAKTLGASHPIGVFDPITGDTQVKFHSIVYYDVGFLSVDENRVISLFMQTLIVASLIGLFVYFIFVRLTLFPIRQLNDQIISALREKTDDVKVDVDDNHIQSLVTQVNFLLSRTNAFTEQDQSLSDPQVIANQYYQLIKILSDAALMINVDLTVVAMNSAFSEIGQVTEDQLLNQNIEILSDSSLVQSLKELVVLAQEAPQQTHTKELHFSQFTCAITIRALFQASSSPKPDFYFIALQKKIEGENQL